MLQVGDLIYHSIFCLKGIVVNLYTNWDNKYCDIYWLHSGNIANSVTTNECHKIS